MAVFYNWMRMMYDLCLCIFDGFALQEFNRCLLEYLCACFIALLWAKNWQTCHEYGIDSLIVLPWAEICRTCYEFRMIAIVGNLTNPPQTKFNNLTKLLCNINSLLDHAFTLIYYNWVVTAYMLGVWYIIHVIFSNLIVCEGGKIGGQ